MGLVEEKLNFLLKKMDDKFKPLKKTFGAAREKLEAEVGYQPRVVVDEEEVQQEEEEAEEDLDEQDFKYSIFIIEDPDLEPDPDL